MRQFGIVLNLSINSKSVGASGRMRPAPVNARRRSMCSLTPGGSFPVGVHSRSNGVPLSWRSSASAVESLPPEHATISRAKPCAISHYSTNGEADARVFLRLPGWVCLAWPPKPRRRGRLERKQILGRVASKLLCKLLDHHCYVVVYAPRQIDDAVKRVEVIALDE